MCGLKDLHDGRLHWRFFLMSCQTGGRSFCCLNLTDTRKYWKCCRVWIWLTYILCMQTDNSNVGTTIERSKLIQMRCVERISSTPSSWKSASLDFCTVSRLITDMPVESQLSSRMWSPEGPEYFECQLICEGSLNFWYTLECARNCSFLSAVERRTTFWSGHILADGPDKC